jgi:hypothetical protein
MNDLKPSFSAIFSGISMEEVFLKIKDYIRDNAANVMWDRQNLNQ